MLLFRSSKSFVGVRITAGLPVCRLSSRMPISTGPRDPLARPPSPSRGAVLFSMRDLLPPVAILKAAKEAGAIDLDPEASLRVLRRYVQLSKDKEDGWERRLCAEQNTPPRMLFVLGSILNRFPGIPQKTFAKDLMMSASSLGDPSATIFLLTAAVRHGQTLRVDLAPVIGRLKRLAKNGTVEAMILLGKILEVDKKENEALDLFRRAAAVAKSGNKEAGAANIDLQLNDLRGEALVAEAQILVRRNDPGAEALLKTAALEIDNPEAYFYLAMLQESSSPKRESYLMKAASSGLTPACHELGLFYLSKSKTDSVQGNIKSNESLQMAREWLQVSASEGLSESTALLNSFS